MMFDRIAARTLTFEQGRRTPAALELGCGEGHALLELQMQYQDSNVSCVNSLKYASNCKKYHSPNCGNGLLLESSRTIMMSTAEFFSVVVNVQAPWPTIVYADYGGSPLPFPDASQDLVFSQYALDVPEMPFVLCDTARMLRTEGIAALHIVYSFPYTQMRDSWIDHANVQQVWSDLQAAGFASGYNASALEVTPLASRYDSVATDEAAAVCLETFLIMTGASPNIPSTPLQLTARSGVHLLMNKAKAPCSPKAGSAFKKPPDIRGKVPGHDTSHTKFLNQWPAFLHSMFGSAHQRASGKVRCPFSL
jgi:SAM-dependent methyltransferase